MAKSSPGSSFYQFSALGRTYVPGNSFSAFSTNGRCGHISSTVLINTSRGSIINELDLIKALDDEIIAGVGLDVYDKEPLPQDHKLRFLPNALLLPHLGYVTVENYALFYNQMLENLDSCFKNKPLRKLI